MDSLEVLREALGGLLETGFDAKKYTASFQWAQVAEHAYRYVGLKGSSVLYPQAELQTSNYIPLHGYEPIYSTANVMSKTSGKKKEYNIIPR